jgi:hypothetical protein
MGSEIHSVAYFGMKCLASRFFAADWGDYLVERYGMKGLTARSVMLKHLEMYWCLMMASDLKIY